MATQEDRSLSSGVSIPRWMKSKITDKFDFDQSAFSPTEPDDSFMYYYRHPVKERRGSDNKILSSNIKESNISVTQVSTKKPDFSKHPPPCQKYLQNEDNPIVTKTLDGRMKSNGTDDGFKGEAAKCGSSIIRVAHQMVAGKVVHGFHLAEDDDCDPDLKNFDPHKRRGSKSLPASPLTSPNSSPKSRRRVNKYFTGAYTDTDKSKGSWILSNLLARRSLSQSVSGFIGEETKEDLERSASTMSVDDVPVSKPNQVYKAQPSELREMNFWSPTSM